MTIDRRAAHAPRAEALAAEIAQLRSCCVGCEGCRGLCLELIEMLTLPGAVLNPARPS